MISSKARTARNRPPLLMAAAAGLFGALMAPQPTLAGVPSEASVKAMIMEGDVSRAVEAARQRIADNPNDAEAYVLLANALLKRATRGASALPPQAGGSAASVSAADADAITSELERALSIAPERKDVHLGLVELARAAGREDEMIRQVDRAVQRFPADTGMMRGLLEFASDAMKQADMSLAERLTASIIAGYPLQPDAILARASLLLSQGDLNRALEVLRAGAAAAPRSAIVVQAFADASCYQRDFQTAVSLYAKAAALDATGKTVRFAWATALHVTDPKAARLIAEPIWGGNVSADKGPPKIDPEASSKSGSRLSNAGTLLMRALSRPSAGAFESYTLAKSFAQAGFGPASIAETEVALSKDSALLEAWILRAEVYTRIGLVQQALDATVRAEAILDAAPNRTFGYTRDEVLAARAGAESRAGKIEEALATYRRTPDPSRYGFGMALLAERLGRIEEARGLLQQVVTSHADPAEVDAAKARLASDVYRKKP